MNLIDRCSLLSPAALPLVTNWAKHNLADGNYEAWYNGQMNLTIVPFGAGDADPSIVGTVVPVTELGLTEEWCAACITFFTQTEIEAGTTDLADEEDAPSYEDSALVIDEAVLKAALRDMVRRSRDEAELRALIADDKRFTGTPAIHVDPNYQGAWLSPSSVMLMVHRSGDGKTIQI